MWMWLCGRVLGGVHVYCSICVYRLLECCGGGLCSVYMCGRWLYVWYVYVVCVSYVYVICVWEYEECMYRVVCV